MISYLLFIATVGGIYGLLALSLNLIWGGVGMVNLGLAGALYGHFTSYIAPDLFLPLITVYIFLAVASGGTGRPAGALLGAYLVMGLLESSRFFVEWIPDVTAVQRAALKELLIAVALILVLRLKPSGILPERIPPAPHQARK